MGEKIVSFLLVILIIAIMILHTRDFYIKQNKEKQEERQKIDELNKQKVIPPQIKDKYV